VLPIVNYRRISEPFSGGGFFDLNLNGARIVRDYSDPAVLNEGELRTSAILKYTQPLRLDSGHLLDLGLSLRGDLYSLDDIQTGAPSAPSTYTGTKSRTNAAASAIWRYPMYRSFGNRTELLEPTIQVISSPRQKADANADIPNMDSKYMELEVENLFSEDRFSGYDVFESGTRVNYGLKFSQEYAGGQGMSLFIGQNFNANVPEDIYLVNSGLADGSGFSNIVTSLVYSPSSMLRLGFKSRVDNEKFKMNRNEVNLYAGTPALNLTVNYVYLRNMYIEGDLPVRKDEINAYLRSRLTRRWSVYFGNRYDLYQDRDITLLGGLAYENDCFKWSVSFINEFTRDRDYVGDKAVYLSLTFRTLGTVSTGFGIGTESRNNSTESGSTAASTGTGK
jgi:LPS-assembly protein